MNVETARFGTLTIHSEDLLEFPQGMLGFPQLRHFFILDHTAGPFRWLQSADDPDIAFVIIDPTCVVSDYRVRLDRRDLSALGLDANNGWSDDLVVAVIANVSNPHAPTVNLLAPICMCANNRRGLQSVQHQSGLSARHPIGRSDSTSNRKAA
ncbi:MAG: flagellar assembly protein FliW [Myxococcota bacterium]